VSRRGLPVIACMLALALLAGSVAACSPTEPVRSARGVLGTSVQMTVYGQPAEVRPSMERAWAAMSAVETQLDPYDATSSIAAINADPYREHELPADALAIYTALDRLGVGPFFSPAMWGVTKLYDFGGNGSVPSTEALQFAAMRASLLKRSGATVTFGPTPSGPGGIATGVPQPGFDFGGASKGLALDRAGDIMRADPAVKGALLSAGSSTLAWGAKDDATPWKIGIEDPRDPNTVVAVISSTSTLPVTVSTSGDYQTYFERSGVRYHHILDPATGLPARGLRSLTVYGPMTALDSDILSTALFVMGPTRAAEFSRMNGWGLCAIDASGTVTVVDPPKDTGLTLEKVAAPKK
jgi:FAD:protein FMN transferase